MVRTRAALGLVALLASGCVTNPTTPAPSQGAVATTTPPSIAPFESPSPIPSPTAPPTFPLAVVTGLTNPKGGITLAELTAMAAAGTVVWPCGVEVVTPALVAPPTCEPGGQIPGLLQGATSTVALLPAGLVEPATRTLPIGGGGPFGLFGADLFGDPAARALPYPVVGRLAAGATVDPRWLDYDPSSVWTLSSVGGVCSDRGAAYQALTLGKGWGWLFDGGTARYDGPPHLDPSPPEGISPHIVVSPIETGHKGTLAKLVAGADLTIADVECPIVEDFIPNYGSELKFSISADVLPLWRDRLGFDVVYMAANHNTDKGVAGVRSTLKLLPKYDILGTGLGLDLDQALKPAIIERAGVKMGFVAWNDVPGATSATADRAGVAWLTKGNVFRSVKRARAAGAQLVFCDPQWWGGSEYHSDLRDAMFDQLEWFDEAGCDIVIGAGTHLAGPVLLRSLNQHLGLVMASEGNLVFGQDWWQLTQEGVLMTVAFRGTQLANVHLYPYVMVKNARSDLTDPAGAGHYVLDRVWANSTVDYVGG